MSKVEKLESLKKELELLQGRKNKVFQKKHSEMNTFFKEYFNGLPFSNVGGYDQDTFYFEVDNGDYKKEICRLDLRKEDWKAKSFDDIKISYYSTSESSEFELNRLITIGKIAELVKNYSKEILYSHKHVSNKYNKVQNKIQKLIWAKESELNIINNQLAQEANDKHRAKAFSNKGISFAKPKRIDLKNGYSAWNVVNLRILGWVNENKKSVDIQTTREAQVWDNEQEKYVTCDPIVENHNKIRYQNIKWIVENA